MSLQHFFFVLISRFAMPSLLCKRFRSLFQRPFLLQRQKGQVNKFITGNKPSSFEGSQSFVGFQITSINQHGPQRSISITSPHSFLSVGRKEAGTVKQPKWRGKGGDGRDAELAKHYRLPKKPEGWQITAARNYHNYYLPSGLAAGS